MPTFLHPSTVDAILTNNTGSIMSVLFIKRSSGEMRRIVGRAGVKRYVKGMGKTYSDKDYNLYCLYDMEAAKGLDEANRSKAYRCFGIDSVISIVVGGVMYKG